MPEDFAGPQEVLDGFRFAGEEVAGGVVCLYLRCLIAQYGRDRGHEQQDGSPVIDIKRHSAAFDYGAEPG